MPKAPENIREFAGLVKIVEFLRSPEGCPWDKEQTHRSLTRYALEEAFELSEAIDSNDLTAIREELGDVLLQVVLHAEIARQSGEFDIFDVIQAISEKMVRRHPHVFANTKAKNSAEVLENWAMIKAREKGGAKREFGIPTGLPSLLHAQKVGEKTRQHDFDWQDARACWPKIHEEIRELEAAMASGEHNEIEAELGDLLFSLAQLARHLSIDSEQALRITNQRFEKRFWRMHDLAESDGREWSSLTAAEKEIYWKRAKA